MSSKAQSSLRSVWQLGTNTIHMYFGGEKGKDFFPKSKQTIVLLTNPFLLTVQLEKRLWLNTLLPWVRDTWPGQSTPLPLRPCPTRSSATSGTPSPTSAWSPVTFKSIPRPLVSSWPQRSSGRCSTMGPTLSGTWSTSSLTRSTTSMTQRGGSCGKKFLFFYQITSTSSCSGMVTSNIFSILVLRLAFSIRAYFALTLIMALSRYMGVVAICLHQRNSCQEVNKISLWP